MATVGNIRCASDSIAECSHVIDEKESKVKSSQFHDTIGHRLLPFCAVSAVSFVILPHTKICGLVGLEMTEIT